MMRTRHNRWTWIAVLLALSFSGALRAEQNGGAAGGAVGGKLDTSRGDAMIKAYFKQETDRIAAAALTDVKTLDQWKVQREVLRAQMFDMMGLNPLPEKTDLRATVTGRVEREDYVVEKLHFQSRPGLYVTGDLYLPKKIEKPVPAVLYVCGHGGVKKNGVPMGNKVHYQHHGVWFARAGYACLMIDSLQLGEIEGIHHGTYNKDMWWWISRGYSPAGVEAWNCIRALDYLETRPEIDKNRFGVTGRSGGGAYSWWISALDERIKVSVPVAGITDMTNHVYDGGMPGRFHDGCVEGHCDCMYMFNTFQWDYPMVAALVAPRPLLISNTDKDSIFPLDGVVRLHAKVRSIYDLYGAGEKLGLQITEGPHADTQELRIHAFVWFNRWLMDKKDLIDPTCKAEFDSEELKVFGMKPGDLPADQKNATIQETFAPKAPPPTVPGNAEAWRAMRDEWMRGLREMTFRGWPNDGEESLDFKPAFNAVDDGVRLSAYDFTSQGPFRLRLYVMQRDGLKDADLVVLNVLDDEGWSKFLAMARGSAAFAKTLNGEAAVDADAKEWQSQRDMLKGQKWVMAYVAPRGVGPTAWDQDARKRVQYRRRFMLLGQSLDGQRVWDARRSIQALRSVETLKDTPLWLQSERRMAGVALYASLFEPKVARLDLWNLPTTHDEGPFLCNVMRMLDTPAAVAMATERSQVRIYSTDENAWKFATDSGKTLGWPEKQLQLRKVPSEPAAGK